MLAAPSCLVPRPNTRVPLQLSVIAGYYSRLIGVGLSFSYQFCVRRDYTSSGRIHSPPF
jgi:hypothetical protein